ncbi:MAG TPA: DUF1553 domain-containing protein, partial [Pirellulaceae bacterium]|nr:DUF1553 domain-containing protein [Pirellulaceae bacterium]
ADIDAWAARVVAPDSVRWTPSELVAITGGKPAATLDDNHVEAAVAPQLKRESIQFRLRPSRDKITALRIEVTNAATNAAGDKAPVQLLDVKLAAPPNADANSKSPATKSPGNAKSEKPRVIAIRAASAGDSLPTEAVAKLLAGGGKPDSAIVLKPTTKHNVVVVLETPLDELTEAPNGATANAEARELELTLSLLGGAADAAQPNDSPTRWRVFTTDVACEQLVPANLLALAAKETGKRTPAETKQLVDFRLAQHDEHRRATADVETYKKQIAATEAEVVTTLVMEEQPQPRATHILMRGVYEKPGEAVTAATPAILPQLDPTAPRNRLGLARWLVGEENPLTARVTVNRFWQQFFGTGLVRTSEDFGAQGEAPSHPELLDWLAVTFRECGWDVKNLVRLIVTSATYRQQSQASAELRQRDPDNRLLSRGPRHRLIGELVRDQALAASGLLVRKIGGPSVKPYHPPGLYEQVTAGSGYNVYVPGKGDDLHRRSLYTYWKRSVPHPAMLLFDAPFRETCALRRSRSNTPLQALNLLNDPTYVEAANHLGRRMLVEGGESVEQRLVHGFRLVLARRPRDLELKVLRTAYDRALADFQRDPESAIALLNVGDS